MAEFEEILLEDSNSKAPQMEFIHSQLLMRKGDDGDINDHAYDHDHDHVVMGPFSGGGSFSSHHQMSLYQSDDHHHGRILGFGGADKSSSMSSQHLFNFSSPSASKTGLAIGNNNNKMNLGGVNKKRKRNNNVVEKPKEVVHVRAKRGQATDSHSLAERVRREKINERLRCLQDLVPGCYKTMGMAVMLDVIINYVRSLQNQIEFLSMKLSAASMYNDLNFLEMAVDTMQSTDHHGTEAYEAWAKW